MKNLNVFNNYVCPWKYIKNWGTNIGTFFRSFKWAYQRATRGFADKDVWNLDTYLTELIADSVEQLADIQHGWPGTDEFPTPESWDEYLRKAVSLLRYSLGELPNKYEKEWMDTWINDEDMLRHITDPTDSDKEITKKFLDVEQENELKQRDAQNEGLRMLFAVWNSLWD